MNDSKPSTQTRIHYLLVIFSIVLTFALAYTLISRYLETNALPTKPGDLGTFGDYLGGVLNPTIAGLALIWLIYSVSIQTEELRETNKALAATVDTAKQQQQQIATQNFENLFFQLLSTLNFITNNIQAGSKDTFSKISDKYINENNNSADSKAKRNSFILRFDSSERVITGKESIKDHIIFYKGYCYYEWEYFYNEAIDDYFGSYFRTCYQILKLITNSPALTFDNDISKPNLTEQKKYFDLFRAQLSSYELEALFFNCLSAHGRSKFKELIEDFGLFEHLLLDHTREVESRHRLTMYAYKYRKSVFELNKKWKNYFLDLEKVAKSKNEINYFMNCCLKYGLLKQNYYITTEDANTILNRLFKKTKKNYENQIKSDIERIKDEKEFIKLNLSKLNQLKAPQKNNVLNSFSLKKETHQIIALKYRIKRSQKDLITLKRDSKYHRKIYKLLSRFKHKQELLIILKYRINFNDFYNFLNNSNNNFPE